MLFKELIKDVSLASVHGDARMWDVCDIVYNSANAKAGAVFVCIVGARSDGHTYAQSAYDKGCRIFIVSHDLSLPDDAAIYMAKDTRIALAELSSAFFEHPSKSLNIIGITGTKGKTTSSLLIAGLLSSLGENVGYIGSNGIDYAGKHYNTANTTPESYNLHSCFRSMVNAGVTTVVMEVSSQAILMHRVHGIRFCTCVFTNLAHDHIGVGEHPTFENYRDCKAALFSDFGCSTMIYNAYDASSEYMRRNASAERYYSFSSQAEADFYADKISSYRRDGMLGVDFTLHAYGEALAASLSMAGDFNVENALCAIAVCTTLVKEKKLALHFDGDREMLDAFALVLSELSVDGRCQVVKNEYLPDRSFVIDYAHNGYSLSVVLQLLRSYCPRRLVCLFGSVGERSLDRREELATVASQLADLSIITSDNPGEEQPEKIIDEIYSYFKDAQHKAVKITDREEAIAYAVDISRPGDIILLAGKGHEDYQLVGKEKRPFNEKSLVKKYARQKAALPI
jgi:UDP-N-acetylmuramoyl-L-alanyl-D-glutamate--2,6-diaminopimelate ligase